MMKRQLPPISSRILAQVGKGNLSPLDYEPLFRICLRHGNVRVDDLLHACYGYEQRIAAKMNSIEQEHPGIYSKANFADALSLLDAYLVSEDQLHEISHIPGAQQAALTLKYHQLQEELKRVCKYRNGLLFQAVPRAQESNL